ncbi:MAG: hypothetical protein K2Q14_04355, partial [Gammaproteobacteria bacterium]|nr:hypothetical protein [Gammaproteobacteria bacterium]
MERTSYFNATRTTLLSALLLFAAGNVSAASTLDAMNSLTPASPTKSAMPGQTMLIPNPPVLNAKGYYLMDADSGNMIASQNADTHLAPASLT